MNRVIIFSFLFLFLIPFTIGELAGDTTPYLSPVDMVLLSDGEAVVGVPEPIYLAAIGTEEGGLSGSVVADAIISWNPDMADYTGFESENEYFYQDTMVFGYPSPNDNTNDGLFYLLTWSPLGDHHLIYYDEYFIYATLWFTPKETGQLDINFIPELTLEGSNNNVIVWETVVAEFTPMIISENLIGTSLNVIEPFGTIHFEPNFDNTEWKVYGSHEAIACCYEFYLPPDIADKIIGYEVVAPLDLFQDMSYRVMDVPNHPELPINGYGQAIGSYPLGEMQESFDGLLGTLYASEPIDLRIEDYDETDMYPGIFWFDGSIPNYPRETTYWIDEYQPPNNNFRLIVNAIRQVFF